MKIGILGVGRLGLCFALNLDKLQLFNVFGYDIRSSYIESLKTKTFCSLEPGVNELLATSTVNFTSDIQNVKHCDILFIMVNTPSLSDGQFDHSQINEILFHLNDYTGPIVISSTVMPGYCDSLNNDNIIYNPQFIAQGTILANQLNPDLVLIGSKSDEFTQTIKTIYMQLSHSPTIKKMNRIEAEITKLALNCYITTKISFANMVGDICNFAGADPEKVLSTISIDSRIGSKCFLYGYGFGGPCFPRDNKAFIHFAKNRKIKPFICQATDEVNNDHLIQQLKLIDMGIIPSNILIDGKHAIITDVSYKAKSQLLEESQQLKLAVALSENYDVTIRDSIFIINELKEKFGHKFQYEVI